MAVSLARALIKNSIQDDIIRDLSGGSVNLMSLCAESTQEAQQNYFKIQICSSKKRRRAINGNHDEKTPWHVYK